MPIRVSFGRACLDTRLALDVSQQQLATRVGVSRSYIGRIERGEANPSLKLVQAIADALGLELELIGRPPVVHGDRRIRDIVHARCSAHIDRRLRSHSLETAREVEVVHGRSHGWIDLLAFDPRTGTLLLIEIKTRLDDIGAIERQFAWYERSAWTLAQDLGWRPRRIRSWLLVLASDEVDSMIWKNRDLFATAFPRRARDLALDIDGTSTPETMGRGLAMIDPSNRGAEWLIRTRSDGRRSPARYIDYADVARRPMP